MAIDLLRLRPPLAAGPQVLGAWLDEVLDNPPPEAIDLHATWEAIVPAILEANTVSLFAELYTRARSMRMGYSATPLAIAQQVVDRGQQESLKYLLEPGRMEEPELDRLFHHAIDEREVECTVGLYQALVQQPLSELGAALMSGSPTAMQRLSTASCQHKLACVPIAIVLGRADVLQALLADSAVAQALQSDTTSYPLPHLGLAYLHGHQAIQKLILVHTHPAAIHAWVHAQLHRPGRFQGVTGPTLAIVELMAPRLERQTVEEVIEFYPGLLSPRLQARQAEFQSQDVREALASHLSEPISAPSRPRV